jgi:hypothetical protein
VAVLTMLAALVGGELLTGQEDTVERARHIVPHARRLVQP